MKKIRDYRIDTAKRLAGLHVEPLRMLPKFILPYAGLFSIAVSGIVTLGIKTGAGREALVALIVLTLMFAGIFAMAIKREKRAKAELQERATESQLGFRSERRIEGTSEKDGE
jgi:hypothetical protein